MKQGVPTITAPISRAKKRRRRRCRRDDASTIAIVCAMAIFTCFSTAMVARSLLISSPSSPSPPSSSDGGNADASAGGAPSSDEKTTVSSLRGRNRSDAGSDNDGVTPPLPEDGAEEVGDSSRSSSSSPPPPPLPRGIVMRTSLGDVTIHFTPELSGESSIGYVADVILAAASSGGGCERCEFYRAEPNMLLQGVIAHHPSAASRDDVAVVRLGPCPIENYVPENECPKHDPDCGCHGPVMTRGMVGWAGGGSGPDFFINTHVSYKVLFGTFPLFLEKRESFLKERKRESF